MNLIEENNFNNSKPVFLNNQIDNINDLPEENNISFADLGLDNDTLAAVEKKGFSAPSPIQVLAIPRLLSGDSNIIARARTGTGKTAAFGLPLIQKLRQSKGGVQALVLEPTRELAIQTCTEIQSFSENQYPRTCVIYGGASYNTQIKDLKRGAEIVVGTPGRVQDHLERGTLDISKIEYFILDEGDEMLDMGFIEDIEAIFKQANPQSRILLFSATMPEPILKIASEFMGEYEIIEEEKVINEPLLIDQKFWFVRENEKPDALIRLIDISDDFYGVVFTQTKNDADFVSRILDEKGYEAAALHGDIAQIQREKILSRFRRKKTRILAATDVAARGIDISGLSHVVNYSLPFDGATYVHRIGRTGRAGAEGTAVTFVRPEESRKLKFLQRAIRKASKGEMKEEAVPSSETVIMKKQLRLLMELKEKLGLNLISRMKKETEATDFESPKNDDRDEDEKNSHILAVTNELETTAENILFSDPVIGSTSNSSLKKPEPFFEKMAAELCRNEDAQNVLASVLSIIYSPQLDKSRYGKIQTKTDSPNQMRLYVQMGRRDGYNPRGIADYFSNLLNIPGRLVDRIDMSSNFTLLSLPKDTAFRAIELSKASKKVPLIRLDSKDEKGGRYTGQKNNFEKGSTKKRYSGRFAASGRSRKGYNTSAEKSGAGIYRKNKTGRF